MRVLLERGVRHADVRRAVGGSTRYGDWPLSEAPLATTAGRRPDRAARERRGLRAGPRGWQLVVAPPRWRTCGCGCAERQLRWVGSCARAACIRRSVLIAVAGALDRQLRGVAAPAPRGPADDRAVDRLAERAERVRERVAGAPSRESSAGSTARSGRGPRRARRRRPRPRAPAGATSQRAVPGGELGVAAAVGERGEVGEQRRDVRRRRAPRRAAPGCARAAGRRRLRRSGEPAADALRGREAVQPVGGGAGGELAQQLARGGGAAAQRLAGAPPSRAAEPVQWAASWLAIA